ncbi:MAG TPA: hypothetical protein VF815_28030 [Myxococcaceae bacterium]|jgi:hypothetical protein
MKIEEQKASTSGTFDVYGQARGFMLQPVQDAYFPVTVVVKTQGEADQYIYLTEERPLYLEPFTRLEVSNAPAASTWLVHLAEHATDIIGPPRGDGRAVRLGARTLPPTIAAGSYYVGGTGSGDPKVYDVSRFSQVSAIVAASAGNAITNTESIKAYMRLINRTGLGATEVIPCGFTNEFFSNGASRSGSIIIGEGLFAASLEYTTIDGRRWPSDVSVYVDVNESISTEEGVVLELWGIP